MPLSLLVGPGASEREHQAVAGERQISDIEPASSERRNAAVKPGSGSVGGRLLPLSPLLQEHYASVQEHDLRVSRLGNDLLALYAAMREAIDDVDDDTSGPASVLLLALKAARLHVVLRWAGPDETARATS